MFLEDAMLSHTVEIFHYTVTLLSVASEMISESPSAVTTVWRLQAENRALQLQ